MQLENMINLLITWYNVILIKACISKEITLSKNGRQWTYFLEKISDPEARLPVLSLFSVKKQGRGQREFMPTMPTLTVHWNLAYILSQIINTWCA